MYTPENIEMLGENEIFVFGSNKLGLHGGGAARLAHDKFGAEWGVGEGLTGQCYAFPTLSAPAGSGAKLSHDELVDSVVKFHETALDNPDKVFYLTKVGCGLAGYDEKYMSGLFLYSPGNVIKPEGW